MAVMQQMEQQSVTARLRSSQHAVTATEQERERRMYESAAELWRMATGEAVPRGVTGAVPRAVPQRCVPRRPSAAYAA